MRVHLALGLLSTITLGCNDRSVGVLDMREDGTFTQRFGDGIGRKIDILFVIDSSASMEEEQRGLGKAFPGFMQGLETIPALSWRIGVTTTDLGSFGYSLATCEGSGDGGRLRKGHASCGAPSETFLWRDKNGTNAPGGDVERAFSCMADVGTDGCSFEMPMRSARETLTAELGAGGFLRPDAALAVVIVTDEDDCSVVDPSVLAPGAPGMGPAGIRCFTQGVVCDEGPSDPTDTGVRSGCQPADGGPLETPETLVDFLAGMRPAGLDRVVVAILAGPPTPVAVGVDGTGRLTLLPSCVSGFGKAAPAVRLETAANELGDAGLFASLCDGDFAPALESLGNRIGDVIEARCLFAAPANADTTPECSVVSDDAPLPACEGHETGACWRLVADGTCASGWSLEAPGADVEISCVTE